MVSKKKKDEVEGAVEASETEITEEAVVEASADETGGAVEAAAEPTETETAEPVAEEAAEAAPAEEAAVEAAPAEEVAAEAAPAEEKAEGPKKAAAKKPAAKKAEKVAAAPADGSETVKKAGKRAEKVGIVQSDKMTKTVVVRVDRVVKHPVYRKYVKRKKKFMAHDDLGAKTGDKVRIVETRPLSARKRWRVIEIIQKAER
jgi:small subunit ribosomal protein S17